MQNIEEYVLKKSQIESQGFHTAIVEIIEENKIFIKIFRKVVLGSPNVYIILKDENDEVVSIQKQKIENQMLILTLNENILSKIATKDNVVKKEIRVYVCYETEDNWLLKSLWNDKLDGKNEIVKENKRISNPFKFIVNERKIKIIPCYDENGVITLQCIDETYGYYEKGLFQLYKCEKDDCSLKLTILKHGRKGEIVSLVAVHKEKYERYEFKVAESNDNVDYVESSIDLSILDLGEWDLYGVFILDDEFNYGGLRTSKNGLPILIKNGEFTVSRVTINNKNMLTIINESSLVVLNTNNYYKMPNNLESFESILYNNNPKGRTEAQMQVSSDGEVLINLQEDFSFAEEIKIVLFNTNINKVVAIQNVYTNNKEIKFRFNHSVMESFINTEVNYVRVCIAVFSGEICYYSYLTKFLSEEQRQERINDLDLYFEPVYNFSKDEKECLCIPFYAKNGVLSIKKMCKEFRYQNVISYNLLDVNIKNSRINLSVECPNFIKGYERILLKSKSYIEDEKKEDNVYIDCTIEYLEKGTPILTASIDIKKLSLAPDLYDVFIIFDEAYIDIKADKDLMITYRKNIENKIEYDYMEKKAYSFVRFGDSCELQLRTSYSQYEYAVSIIMAIYNTDLFLEEALDSIVEQKLDTFYNKSVCYKQKDYRNNLYERAYQVILVDDGSPDSSGEICDRYEEKYPEFISIHKENGGVSSARNLGMNYAKGKYLNFMDSDDKFSNMVLKNCYNYLETYYDRIDLVTFPLVFFDADSGDHWLNEKFQKGNRIIHLNTEFDASLLFVNATLFKSEVVLPNYRFDSQLKTGEDSKFIYNIFITHNPRFGVINTCTYWYRRRSTGSESAIQGAKSDRNYYINYMQHFMDWIVDLCNKEFGFIPKFVQHLIVQQLQWRFLQDKDAKIVLSVLSQEEFDTYKEKIKYLLTCVDDAIIMGQKKIFREQKNYMLFLKHGFYPRYEYYNNDLQLFYMNTAVTWLSSCYSQFDFIKIDGNNLILDGYTMILGFSHDEPVEIYVSIDDEMIKCDYIERDKHVRSFNDIIFRSIGFYVSVNIQKIKSVSNIKLFIKIKDYFIKRDCFRYGRLCPIATKYNNSYYAKNGWLLKPGRDYITVVNLTDQILNVKNEDYEKKFISEIKNNIKENEENILKALELRKLYFKIKSTYNSKEKQIWLISDRAAQAGDNGEAFYKFMLNQEQNNIEFYFVIDKDSNDFERLNYTGRLVEYNSDKHKILHLLADAIISAHGNDYVFNPFVIDGTTDIFRDLTYEHKYIFLQHGITKDDISKWLNRYNKDIDGFVTAAIPEHKSIIEYNYYYNESQVWLTGFPRHDLLYKNEQKYIIIMPTWRRYLLNCNLVDTNLFEVKDNFKESLFYKFYNALFNDKKLIKTAKKYGYKIFCKSHPIMSIADKEFDLNENIKFFDETKLYTDIFAEGNLMITDYSSSVMDFAYLRKPVIYCHFDKEEFFSGDTMYEQGYFEYERDGFGEVVYDIDSLINTVVEYIENDCAIKDKYKERINNFFAYNDKNNCQRVYEKIMELISK